jgi:hypothetical protein
VLDVNGTRIDNDQNEDITKMCVVNASNVYSMTPTGDAHVDTTIPGFQMFDSTTITNDVFGMSKKSTTELLSHHMCVRGGSDLHCCGNYSYVGEVQYRDDK